MFYDYLALIFHAALTTLGLAVCSLVVGLILGIFFTALESNKYPIIAKTTYVLVMLLRGLPEILVVLLIYFGSTEIVELLTGEYIHLIMPQVWRHALPGLSNQWLVLLKDTALVSLIGVDDLMRQAGLINTNTHQPFTWYGIAALIYLAVTLVSQVAIRKLERRFTRFERGNA